VKDWPAWATESVEVGEPDVAWQELGDRECLLLEANLGTWLVAPIEHVGSTAVANLAAKRILDFQTAVTYLDWAADIAIALAPAGWHYVPPELDARAWRRFLVKVAQGRRVAHLHVMLLNNPRWRQELAFRDASACRPRPCPALRSPQGSPRVATRQQPRGLHRGQGGLHCGCRGEGRDEV
jgi:GrpB-like predicted nucleotidyltransferase (UPF0157 family)